jgi:amino acid adenylation domain-containing protein
MTNPGAPPGETLDAADELIRLGDGGPVPPGAEIVAHRRFEQIARANPGLTAVVSYDETLTYGELDARANAMCRRLRAAGVGLEQVVAICLPRRLDVLVAVLAVIKSGGAYLPLDLVQPLERRRFMVRDAGASALVTVPGWEAELGEGSLAVVHPDTDVDEPAGETVPAGGEPALDDLAYIIYTSGSTGEPKGVMVEQRSLAAYVDWGVSHFTPEELRVVLMATSFGFDMSVFEFMLPLSVGGQIVLVDSLFEIRDVEHHGLTLVNAVPSLMAALLGSGITLPKSVRTAVFCGEALPFEVSEAVHRQPGIERVVNTYGPTEDTVYSTCVDVPRGVRPTIGRPFPGTQAYVVDEALNLVPRGHEGELCLGGVGLARGYRGRDEHTRERFVANPFPGSDRLYRTGDLARWEDDDTLQHLGRIDHQIKLHGVRIEPGDIEEALLRHPDIRQAVVVARERRGGGKWLVGYIVCHSGTEPDGRELRDMLRTSLPKPMIPSIFVRVDALPLNANGKLDRSQLPDPLSGATGSRALTPTEQKIATIWRDLLALDGVPAPEDDYFELGGDSLRAFELFDRIESSLGRELSPNVLLEASTLGSLAALIDSGADRGRLIKLNDDGGRIPFAYVPSGAGGMLTLRKFSAAVGPDQPLYGIQAHIDRDIEAGDISGVEETAAGCLAALLEVQPSGPYMIGGHSIGGHIAYEMATKLEEAGESVVLLSLLDPAAPHTLRRAGRVVARARELTGTGSEPRRPQPHLAAMSALARRVQSLLRNAASAAPEATVDEDPEVWMRNLEVVERRYRPRPYGGRVKVYTTSDGARYTGSATLGWDRYVSGPLDVHRVPGDHVSMLYEPNVDVLAAAMDADIRAAQLAGSDASP